MSRRWLGLALLLSVGINLGILGVLAVERLRGPGAHQEPVTEPATEPATESTGDGGSTAVPDEPPFDPDGRRGPFAGPGRGRGGPDGPNGNGGPPPAVLWRLERLADRLGLEGERRARFLELQRSFFGDTLERRREIFELQNRFRRELASDAPSEETVGELIRRLAEERAALDRDLARTVLEARRLLGPEQEREYLRFLARLGPDQRRGPGQPPRRLPPRP